MPAVSGGSLIRIGILGCSDIARRKFIPAALKSDQARLVALAGRQPDKPGCLPDGLPAKMTTYEGLINDPDIDLVYISLPNHLHEEWSIRALERGKHVICEKPLAPGAASVNRMLATAERHGVLLYENLMYLQHPQHKAVKTLIESGRIGRVLSLWSEFAFPGPATGNFRLDKDMGGGAFHDMNRYPLSAALNFLEGRMHHFFKGSVKTDNGLTMSLQASSFTEAGETFSFLTAFGMPYRSFYVISGERGFIRVDRAYTTPCDMENKVIVMIDNRDESFTILPSDHFLNTIDHVCGLIRCGVWEAEHERSRKLAELAGMFYDNSLRRNLEHAA